MGLSCRVLEQNARLLVLINLPLCKRKNPSNVSASCQKKKKRPVPAMQDVDNLTSDVSQRSKQILNHLEHIAQEQWGTEVHGMDFNNISGGDNSSNEDENGGEGTEDNEDTEDEEMEMEDGYEVTIARNGNNGLISAWERLDEHFLHKAASIGRKPFLRTIWI